MSLLLLLIGSHAELATSFSSAGGRIGIGSSALFNKHANNANNAVQRQGDTVLGVSYLESIVFPDGASSSIKEPSRISPSRTVEPIYINDKYTKESTTSSRLKWPVASGQKQLPLMERIFKALHEESLPWLATLILAAIPSIVIKSTAPLTVTLITEFLFFVHCGIKLLTKFNAPKEPEPILRSEWKDVAKLVWESQNNDIKLNRSFLMGWFYDAPYESLRKEDAISYLAWMKYGLPIENDLLTKEEISSIETIDLPLLIKNVNNGRALPSRQEGEEPLAHIRFNCEPIRFRHKPLLFYAITHGVHNMLHFVLKRNNFTYVKAQDPKKDISYWYRKTDDAETTDPIATTSESKSPLVFVHGVGGLAFCYKMIDDILNSPQVKNDTPIILLDLPHVSLRFYDDIPTIESQMQSIRKTLSKVIGEKTKATFVGHSYGTILLSWMVQKFPEKVAGCVFIDPVCFNLHLKDILFNFHLQRVDKKIQDGKKWDNPMAIESLVNLAGTEMHTNNSMLRQFSWATNSLWPEDLAKNNIPAKIVLTENDEIVPTADVAELFSNFNRPSTQDVRVFKGACHGEMFFDESLREETLHMILDSLDSVKSEVTPADPLERLKKDAKALLGEPRVEFWEQISYILPQATASGG